MNSAIRCVFEFDSPSLIIWMFAFSFQQHFFPWKFIPRFEQSITLWSKFYVCNQRKFQHSIIRSEWYETDDHWLLPIIHLAYHLETSLIQSQFYFRILNHFIECKDKYHSSVCERFQKDCSSTNEGAKNWMKQNCMRTCQYCSDNESNNKATNQKPSKDPSNFWP